MATKKNGFASLFRGEPKVDDKRSTPRRSYSQIMGSFVTVRDELRELVAEKTGHIKRVANDKQKLEQTFKAQMDALKTEHEAAELEQVSAQKSIDFIDSFVPPEVVTTAKTVSAQK